MDNEQKLTCKGPVLFYTMESCKSSTSITLRINLFYYFFGGNGQLQALPNAHNVLKLCLAKASVQIPMYPSFV